MYIAIQAKNITEEKEHHRYYRIYRRYVRHVMSGIAWKCRLGDNVCTYRGKAVRVLDQIADELAHIGYDTEVYSVNENKYEIRVKWD